MRVVRRVLGIAVLLGLLALPLLLWWKFQAIEDWWKLRNYSPPAPIANMATADTMTEYARHVFYVNHPQLVTQTVQFRQQCPVSEQTIVLGCYHSPQRGIAIYDIKDDRLRGVEEVTAAHEMLHAAYDRLGGDDKNYIDGLLQDYYLHELKDQRVVDTINAYEQSEPSEVVNEMHSVFGTEISTLPQPLESYYQRYFSNRNAVTNLAAGYEQEFSSRIAKIKTYDQQLESLKQRIADEEQSFRTQLAQINSDRARLDSLRSSGQIDEYNAAVSDFNAEVSAYNQGILSLRNDIDTYNRLVNERNSIANELRNLSSALDTRLTTQPAQ